MFSSVPTFSRISTLVLLAFLILTSVSVSAPLRIDSLGTDNQPALPEVFGGKTQGGCCDGSRIAAGYSEFGLAVPPQYETYGVHATYYSFNGGLTTTLMLNNKGPQPILTTPTFYSLAGVKLQLAPITVPATSYIDVDMHTLLAEAGPEFREGSVKIAYQGSEYQLGVQVKMVDQQNSLIWAEQFVYTSKFVSNRLENVWWLPGNDTQTNLVVSNTTYSPITLTIEVDGTAPQQSAPVQITLARSETRVLDIMADLVGSPNGTLDTIGGISIVHTGNPGAVLARMFVAEPNRGYSTAIPFVDHENTASQKWHGNGFRLRNLDGQALKPILVARNTTDQLTRIRGRIPYTRPDGEAGFVNIPDAPLPANSTRIINLQGRIASANLPASVTFGGIEIEYDAPKGTVLTQVQSVSQDGNHVFQVPMFDPEKMPASAGGFPWKADGDFRTLVYIKNETDTARKITADLYYDGVSYGIGLTEVKPGQTIAIDFREIRDAQTPDRLGGVIPLGLEHGQIAWSVKGGDNKTLSARSEQISVSEGVASTYSCANCCPDSYYDGILIPYDAEEGIGGVVPFRALQQDSTCFQTLGTPYEVVADWWDSTDVEVAEVDSVGDTTAVGAGTSYIQAGWSGYVWSQPDVGQPCNSEQVPAYGSGPIEIRPTVTITEVGFTGDHPIHKWPHPGTAIDNPDGSSPTWKSTGNPNDPVAYTKSANITMFAKLSISPSIPERNVKIRVKNGSTGIASRDVAISGTSANITGISTTSALESTVKKTTPTFTWEISYNDGSSWSSIGNSGPHTMYWTYSTPLSYPFQNDIDVSWPHTYDEALKRACEYSFGEEVPAGIIWNINEGVDLDINYNPSISIGDKHPLEAYSTPGGCQCSDHANLLRGLLRTIGIDGTRLLIWAGPDSNTLTRYKVGSTGDTNPSFRIIRAAHDSAGQNPHFKFHAVVSTNGTWYDPSYGMSYSSLSFNETAFNNTAQQTSSSFWTEPSTFSGFECGH